MQKVDSLNKGRSYFRHLPSAGTARMCAAGRFPATGEFARTHEVDVARMCVPTRRDRYREPALSYVTNTARAILDCPRPGQLLLLESMTYRAGEINTVMSRLVVECLAEALDRRLGRPLSGSRILIIPLAYQRNIDDLRESPALKLRELWQARGAEADLHDPYVASIPSTPEDVALAGRACSALGTADLAADDALLIATDDDGFDYAVLVAPTKLVVDTPAVGERSGVRADNLVKA
jgi:UDP-N-acetyl-D-mannosaminuronate dehydrogenase